MALTTGGADPLECLLRKVGISDSEFTRGDGNGRVHLYDGMGGTIALRQHQRRRRRFQNATNLWNTVTALRRYDVVLLACEGTSQDGRATRPTAARQAMMDYTALGGRVFASHWHNVWLENGPAPWPATATWNFDDDLVSPITAKIDRTFPKGAALAEWLVNVGRLDGPGRRADPRRPAHGGRQQRHPDPALDLRQQRARRGQRQRPAGHAVLHLQHADHRARGEPVRARGLQRHPRLLGDQREHHLPQRLHDDRPVAAGEDPGVHAVRHRVVHPARHDAAHAADAAARRRPPRPPAVPPTAPPPAAPPAPPPAPPGTPPPPPPPPRRRARPSRCRRRRRRPPGSPRPRRRSSRPLPPPTPPPPPPVVD